MSEGTVGGGDNVSNGAALLQQANAGTTDTGTTPPVADSAPPVPTGQFPTTQPANVQPQNGQSPYHQYLEKIPEGFRPLVKPVFDEWDANVTKRFQEVHSRYEPYKRFLDAEVPADYISDSLDYYNLMNQNPQRVYEALGQYLEQQGLLPQGARAGAEQGQGLDEEIDLGENPDDIANHPVVLELKRQLETLTGGLQQAHQAKIQREEEAEAETWVNQKAVEITEELKGKGLEPDWDYIMSVAGALVEHKGVHHDQALRYATDQYVAKVQGYMGRSTANSTAPTVLPTNGGTPSNQTPNFASDRDRRDFGAAALRAALRNQ